MAVFYKYQYTNKRKNIHPCMRDFFIENLANSAENLHNLHQGATDQVITKSIESSSSLHNRMNHLDEADNRRVRHFSEPFP